MSLSVEVFRHPETGEAHVWFARGLGWESSMLADAGRFGGIRELEWGEFGWDAGAGFEKIGRFCVDRDGVWACSRADNVAASAFMLRWLACLKTRLDGLSSRPC